MKYCPERESGIPFAEIYLSKFNNMFYRVDFREIFIFARFAPRCFIVQSIDMYVIEVSSSRINYSLKQILIVKWFASVLKRECILNLLCLVVEISIWNFQSLMIRITLEWCLNIRVFSCRISVFIICSNAYFCFTESLMYWDIFLCNAIKRFYLF